MKTRFISSCIIVAIVGMASSWTLRSQSFEITAFEPVPVMGTAATSVEHHGTLRNISGSAKTIVVRYTMGGVAFGHFVSMCTDEQCYSLPDENFGTYDLPNEVLLEPNGTVALKAIDNPVGAVGHTVMNFQIFDKNNPTDKIDYNVIFEVGPATDVADLETATSAVVTPNPSDDAFRITGVLASTIAAVMLYDVHGALVHSARFADGDAPQVDVRSLSVGTYSAIVRTTNGNIYRTSISVVR